jgi:hypothetical protein
MRRARIAQGITALGAACIFLAPFAGSARADESPLPVFQATGVGQGLRTTFATVPSIFNPLIEVGTNYTIASIDSQGGGQNNALAAQFYPGTLAVGALGCGGSLPPQFLPLTNELFVKASYPKAQGCDTHASNTILSLPGNGTGNKQLDTLLQTLSMKTGDLHVATDPLQSSSSSATQGLTLAAPAMSPLLSFGSLSVTGTAKAIGKSVQNVVTATAKNISIAAGAVTIGSMISTSTATSNGTVGDAQGTLTFADVKVQLGGSKYAASIDNTGVHVNQPGLSRDQNLGLTEEITEVLTHAGIMLNAASPTKIIDGASGEAAVGGLIVSIDASVPPVPIPPELAPVLAQVINKIPTQCPLQQEGVPICFGPGVLPGPGSNGRLTFNIASTDAFAVGGLSIPGSFGGGIPNPTFGPPVSAPSVLPVTPGTGPQPLTQQPVTGTSGPLHLFGLIARLPAVALLWAGLGLLILAMGYAYGPSLRHVRAR